MVNADDDETIIQVVPIQPEHYSQANQVLNDGFDNKRFCFFIPSPFESLQHMQTRFGKMTLEHRKLTGVAISSSKSGSTTTVLGCVSMVIQGMPLFPDIGHDCKSNEMYIEVLAVSAQARGKGIGTKLLKWCEQTALEKPNISCVTLEVMRGNRAIGLYEKMGFEIQPQTDCIDSCITILFVAFCLGRPYGCCHSEWGVEQMKKMLVIAPA